MKAKDLAVASRQLSTMVSSGMSILRALYVLEAQSKSKLLKSTIVAVRHDVEAGRCCPTRSSAIRRCSAPCT